MPPHEDGVKRKKISVLLDRFVVNHKAARLEQRLERLEAETRTIRAMLADRNGDR